MRDRVFSIGVHFETLVVNYLNATHRSSSCLIWSAFRVLSDFTLLSCSFTQYRMENNYVSSLVLYLWDKYNNNDCSVCIRYRMQWSGRKSGSVVNKRGGIYSLGTSLLGLRVHHILPGPCPPTVILVLFLELKTGRSCDLSPSGCFARCNGSLAGLRGLLHAAGSLRIRRGI